MAKILYNCTKLLQIQTLFVSGRPTFEEKDRRLKILEDLLLGEIGKKRFKLNTNKKYFGARKKYIEHFEK